MTSDEMLGYIVGTFIALFIIGFGGKVLWDHYKSGRIKKGEYYMTVSACEQCRDKCCIGEVKRVVNEHMRKNSYHDSEVNTRLASIEKRMDEAREDSAKMREDVGGIKSALDKMTSVIEIYVKRSDDRDKRDRRTDEMYGGQA